MENYVTPKVAAEQLKVHPLTLKRYEKDGLIETFRTPGGKRMYNVNQYLSDNNLLETNEKEIVREKICYCRVSSHSQKDDLERQIKYMKLKYPNYRIITDIASGLNFNRKGLNEIIDLSVTNKIDEVVIAYKDRLARFGYDLIKMLITKYSKGKLTVINDCSYSPQEELTKDLVNIINVFSAKLNGLRSYKTT